MSQMLNGVFEAFLSLPSLGVLVCLCLFARRIFHGLGAPIGDHGLYSKKDTAHADSQKGQGFVFLGRPQKLADTFFNSFGEHDGHENRQQYNEKTPQNRQQRVRLDPLHQIGCCSGIGGHVVVSVN